MILITVFKVTSVVVQRKETTKKTSLQLKYFFGLSIAYVFDKNQLNS